jgi:hypothetical protein
MSDVGNIIGKTIAGVAIGAAAAAAGTEVTNWFAPVDGTVATALNNLETDKVELPKQIEALKVERASHDIDLNSAENNFTKAEEHHNLIRDEFKRDTANAERESPILKELVKDSRDASDAAADAYAEQLNKVSAIEKKIGIAQERLADNPKATEMLEGADPSRNVKTMAVAGAAAGGVAGFGSGIVGSFTQREADRRAEAARSREAGYTLGA